MRSTFRFQGLLAAPWIPSAPFKSGLAFLLNVTDISTVLVYGTSGIGRGRGL